MTVTSSLLAGKKALIFDLDGTIADTSPLHARAFVETLAPFAVSVDYASLAGLKTHDAIVQCLEAAGRRETEYDLPSLVAEKQRRARDLIAQRLEAKPGVDAFLARARRLYEMALVTSASRDTALVALRKLAYQAVFDPIVCADDVERAKPAPDGFLLALAALHRSPEEALVFEDSEPGFRAARAAGLDVVDARSVNWSEIGERIG